MTGSLEIGKFLRRQLPMHCIQLGSSVSCSRVPQVHFVRKQTMCKSLYKYLTICFAFEKPRWLLHNTADHAETVFSHLKGIQAVAICCFIFNCGDYGRPQFPALKFGWVVITTLYHLMLQSWYQKTAQSLVNTLSSFFLH